MVASVDDNLIYRRRWLSPRPWRLGGENQSGGSSAFPQSAVSALSADTFVSSTLRGENSSIISGGDSPHAGTLSALSADEPSWRRGHKPLPRSRSLCGENRQTIDQGMPLIRYPRIPYEKNHFDAGQSDWKERFAGGL